MSIPKKTEFVLGALINVQGTELSLKNSLANGWAPQKACTREWFELQTRSLADGSVTAKPTVMARDWSLGKKQRKQYKKGHIIKNIKDFTKVHNSFLQRLHFGGLLFYFIFGFRFTLSQILIFVCYLRFGLIILSQIRFHKITALLCFQKKKYIGIVLLGFDLDLLCYVLLSINFNYSMSLLFVW